jgi:hypothetical protein
MDPDFTSAKILRRFFYKGYSYELRRLNTSPEWTIELIMYKGQLHDTYIKIEKKLRSREAILNFLIMRDIPMIEYLDIEKVFLEDVT